ncbi:hypothetical protein MPER_04797, partial [Moniliophthora perniciosa FA553]
HRSRDNPLGFSSFCTSSTSSNDAYTLEAVYLAWSLKNAPVAEYMKKAREGGLLTSFVSVTERKGVVDWGAALPTPAAGTSSPTKRRYVPDSHDAETVKKIKQQEVELRDRNSVLRGVKANNFSSVRQAFADKLKKLKDAGRPGAASAVPTPVPDPKLQARKA